MDPMTAITELLALIDTPMAERTDVQSDMREIIERSHDLAEWFARGGFRPVGPSVARAERIARTIAEVFPIDMIG